jgi:hypothetical protein
MIWFYNIINWSEANWFFNNSFVNNNKMIFCIMFKTNASVWNLFQINILLKVNEETCETPKVMSKFPYIL